MAKALKNELQRLLREAAAIVQQGIDKERGRSEEAIVFEQVLLVQIKPRVRGRAAHSPIGGKKQIYRRVSKETR